MNDKARNKGRMALYAMAGFYLDYMAYMMFQNIGTSHGGEKILMIVCMIFFAIVGTTMMVLGIKTGYKLAKETDDISEEIDDIEAEGNEAEENIEEAEADIEKKGESNR